MHARVCFLHTLCLSYLCLSLSLALSLALSRSLSLSLALSPTLHIIELLFIKNCVDSKPLVGDGKRLALAHGV